MKSAQLEWRSGGPWGSIAVLVDANSKQSSPHLRDAAPPLFHFRFVDLSPSRQGLEASYTAIEDARRVPDVVAALASSLPGLRDLKILKPQKEFLLHLIFEREAPVPAFLAGDGLQRFLRIAAALPSAHEPNQVAMVEEPEWFLHPRYMRELATLLRGVAASGTQVVLSTHSTEMLDALLSEVTPTSSWPTVHRLKLYDGKLSAIRFSADEARTSRTELHADLRGA
jgi:hypothetical protein